MSNKLSQKFQDIVELTPAPGLEKAVLGRIEVLEVAKVKRARIWSLVGFAGSVWGFAYFAAVFGETLWQSEAWSILSLLFSDIRIVAANWNDFGYSVMETFPVVGVVAMLVPTVILLWSMSQYFVWHNRFANRQLV